MNMETGTSFITLMKEWEPIRELSSSKGNTNDSSEAPVFKDVLKNVVGQVYTTQKDVEKKQYLLATGQLDDAHSLPIAEAKAALSLEVMISLRNKAMESYSELMKIDVYKRQSYTYAADAAAGLLAVMLCGKCGEAYNIADSKSDITLRDLSHIIAGLCNTEVIFEIPDAVEKAGYSTATKARLDGSRLKGLGWSMKYDIRTGIERTIDIMRSKE